MLNDNAIRNDWLVAATSEEIPEGKLVPIRILDENIVLWRSNGVVHALNDRCPHRGTRLSLGQIDKQNRIECPYHGWRFNESGECKLMPAHPEQKPPKNTCVTTYQIVEKYGWVWLSFGNPEFDVPAIPVGDDKDYQLVFCGPYLVDAAGPRAIENFLDMAHFPYVHKDYLGEEPNTEIAPYDVEYSIEEGVTATNCKAWQPRTNSQATEGKWVNYTYRVFRPLTAMLWKDPTLDTEKPNDYIMLSIHPIDEITSKAYVVMGLNYGLDKVKSTFSSFQDTIFLQDKDVLESQIPKRLPLDSEGEVPQRADATSIAYRRYLKDLGFSYGTTAYKAK